jgi:hypothetical protein
MIGIYILNNELRDYFNNNDQYIEISDVIEDVMFIISTPYSKIEKIHLCVIFEYNKVNTMNLSKRSGDKELFSGERSLKENIYFELYTVVDPIYTDKLLNIGYSYYDNEWIKYRINLDIFTIYPLVNHIMKINESSLWKLRYNYISLYDENNIINLSDKNINKEYNTMNLSKDLSVDKELFSGTIVKENITKYIFNEIIIREICIFLS